MQSETKAVQNKLKNELNEKADRTHQDINHIKEWIKKTPHLKARLDEQWLLAFLKGSKFSLQEAKNNIDNNYTMKTLLPEYFRNRNPFSPDIQEILDKGLILPLPKTDNKMGQRIILMPWTDFDADRITLNQQMKLYFMIMDILMNEDDNAVTSGVKILIDFKGFNQNYIPQFTPSFLKKAVDCLQNVYPIRIEGLYVYNAPNIFEKIFNMAKMVMNEELRKRTFLYSEANFNKVLDAVPQFLFPKECQGDNGSIPELIAQWKKKVESYKSWYEEEEKYCTIENLRPGKTHTNGDSFGVEGSFRKLNLD